MPKSFEATQSFGQFIYFNDKTRTFMLQDNNTICSYDNIAGYDYIEEHGNMGHGGVARAFSVGFFGEKQGVFVASAMKIKIVLKDSKQEMFINLLITPSKSNNIIYRSLKKSADEIIVKLESIQPQNCEKENRPYDYTEELRRLRRLADDGVISEDDYTMKKKQLLGL